MRILAVDHTAGLGGGELALVRLAGAMAADASLRCLLLSPGPLVEVMSRTGVDVRALTSATGLMSMDRTSAARAGFASFDRLTDLIRTERTLTRVFAATRPDIVYTNTLKSDLLATLPALLTRRPLVWHVHDRIASDYLPSVLVRLVRAMSRVPQAVIVNSRATAATLPRRTVVAYPGLAPDQIRGDVAPVDTGRPHKVVGIVGRLSATKGQDLLIEAFPRIREAHPSTRLVIVGGTPFGEDGYATRLRARVADLGLTDSVTWTGAVEDTRPYLDGMDVCVHASPVPEPFGQVIVEALARAVPVVATDAGGVPEIVGRGPDRLAELVPPGDFAALADAVIGVLDDLPSARQRARRARTVVARDFGIASTVAAVTGVWRDVLRHGRAPR